MNEIEVETIDTMIGVVFDTVENIKDDELVFTTKDGEAHRFFHMQDCCECVTIEDIVGDLEWLKGSPMLESTVASKQTEPGEFACDSGTWTFYRFSTAKGTVTVRWLGESNGYYSEGVNYEVTKS